MGKVLWTAQSGQSTLDNPKWAEYFGQSKVGKVLWTALSGQSTLGSPKNRTLHNERTFALSSFQTSVHNGDRAGHGVGDPCPQSSSLPQQHPDAGDGIPLGLQPLPQDAQQGLTITSPHSCVSPNVPL